MFEFEALAPLSVKGKSKPLEVHRLLRAKRTPPRIAGSSAFRAPLVGRDKEFQALQRALHDLQQGQGAVVALLGEAGLGKSRLVAEVRQSVARGIFWVEARAVAFGDRLSYGVVRDMIEGLGDVRELTPLSDRARRLHAEVQALFPARTEEIFPYLARLCELPLEAGMLERVKYLAPEALHGQLLADSHEAGDLSECAYYQFELGFFHLFRDELDEARKDLETSMGLAARISDVSMRTKCLTYLTLMHRKAGRSEETERCASQALAQANEARNSVYAGSALSHLAWVAWRRGDLAQAEQQARAALARWPHYFPWRLGALWPPFGISVTRQQIEPAATCAREILDPGQCQMPEDVTAALESGLAAFERSDLDRTRAAFQQASELAARIGYLKGPRGHGFWRPIIGTVVRKFLECGDLKPGFTCLRCPRCREELFVPDSCRVRCFCPL